MHLAAPNRAAPPLPQGVFWAGLIQFLRSHAVETPDSPCKIHIHSKDTVTLFPPMQSY